MQNEIEQMAKDLQETHDYEGCDAWHCNGCEYEKYNGNYLCESIMQAERLISKGYRKQQWISVEERLPEQYGLFLIADDKGNMEVASWTKQFGWFSGGNRVKRVTHWMPLPTPPRKEDEGNERK